MSIWVTLQFTVREGANTDLNQFLEAKLPAVRSFDGALSVSVMFNEETSTRLIIEEWKTKEHHQAYIAAISENGVMDQFQSFMAGTLDVQYYKRFSI